MALLWREILAAQRVCLNHFSQPPGRHPAAHRRQSVAVVVKRARGRKRLQDVVQAEVFRLEA